MAIKIRLPYNTTTGVTPTATNLLTGEIAVNTADAKLWVKHSNGSLVLITATGAQGAQGSVGTQGPQGPTGFTGSAGPTGATGPAGTQGSQGSQGTQGTQGPAGAPGSIGPQGGRGPQGPQGPQGFAGRTGAPGPTGPTGRTGSTGAAGPCVPATGMGGTCFLGSSYTTMADGTKKLIKDVKIGDWLMGAFGEANQVLASEDLILGNRPMFIINYTHHTTGDHTHIFADKQFGSIEPNETVMNDWNKWYRCEVADGSFVELFNMGLDNAQERIKKIDIGTVLQTINGSKVVNCIDKYDLPPDTKLYNFVMSGSHTYAVDDYFVTGWPRDDDFDYREWKQKGETSKLEAWM